MNTLEVSFEDVEKYNQNLATTIIEEYYRIYPFLNQAIFNYLLSLADSSMIKVLQKKECYISFVDVPTRHKVRELTTAKIGTLIRISGQIVRTHPVHPELVFGTFVCLDCQTVIKNVEQQFKVWTTHDCFTLLILCNLFFLYCYVRKTYVIIFFGNKSIANITILYMTTWKNYFCISVHNPNNLP